MADDPNEPWPGFHARDSADAVMKDRERCETILSSEHGRRNPTVAHRLAFKDGMAADSAVELLAMIPGAENPAAAAGNPYLAALDREASIDISAPTSGRSLDPREARKAELRQAGKQLGIDRGYRSAERA
jgi:hypothetical protein